MNKKKHLKLDFVIFFFIIYYLFFIFKLQTAFIKLDHDPKQIHLWLLDIQ